MDPFVVWNTIGELGTMFCRIEDVTPLNNPTETSRVYVLPTVNPESEK